MPPRARGFTLLELIVGMVMLGLLAGAVSISVSQMLRARDGTTASAEAFSRARVAAELIATDAASSLRDQDLSFAKVSIARSGRVGDGRDTLVLFTHPSRPARAAGGQAEGNEAEVQYRVLPAQLPGVSPGSNDLTSLWRRQQPVPDAYPDAGGVAAPVVDGVTALTLRCSDGQQWLDTWDSDSDGLPHAIEITVTARDDRARSSATIRRVVAIDRVPIAPVVEEADASGQTAGNSTGTGTNPNSPNGNTGNTGDQTQIGPIGPGPGNGNGPGRGNGNRNGNGGGGPGNPGAGQGNGQPPGGPRGGGPNGGGGTRGGGGGAGGGGGGPR